MVVTSGARPQIGLVLPGSEEITWASPWRSFVDWSPDGSHVLFLRQPDEASALPELSVWNVATGDMSALLPGVISASWSPLGDSIAFLAWGEAQGSNELLLGFYPWSEGGEPTSIEIGEAEENVYPSVI